MRSGDCDSESSCSQPASPTFDCDSPLMGVRHRSSFSPLVTPMSPTLKPEYFFSDDENSLIADEFEDHVPDPQERVGPFVLGETLGAGVTGTVRTAIHADNGFKVAFKVLKKTYLNDNPESWQKVKREIAILKLIEHANIIKLYDVVETNNHLYLVLEHVSGGELFDYILERGRLPRDEALRLTAQIVTGLEHCHAHSICHRDLKPENLLLDDNNCIKIADFGMAQLMKNGNKLRTSCGSPHYASPEVIMGGEYDGKKADVWSVGVILFAQLTGSLPFDHEHLPTLLEKVKAGKFTIPSCVDADIAQLLRSALEVDPEKRIHLSAIRNHACFKGGNYFDSSRQNDIASNLKDPAAVLHRRSLCPQILGDLESLGFGDMSLLTTELTTDATAGDLPEGEHHDTLLRHLQERRKQTRVFYRLLRAQRQRRLLELSCLSPGGSGSRRARERDMPPPLCIDDGVVCEVVYAMPPARVALPNSMMSDDSSIRSQSSLGSPDLSPVVFSSLPPRHPLTVASIVSPLSRSRSAGFSPPSSPSSAVSTPQAYKGIPEPLSLGAHQLSDDLESKLDSFSLPPNDSPTVAAKPNYQYHRPSPILPPPVAPPTPPHPRIDARLCHPLLHRVLQQTHGSQTPPHTPPQTPPQTPNGSHHGGPPMTALQTLRNTPTRVAPPSPPQAARKPGPLTASSRVPSQNNNSTPQQLQQLQQTPRITPPRQTRHSQTYGSSRVAMPYVLGNKPTPKHSPPRTPKQTPTTPKGGPRSQPIPQAYAHAQQQQQQSQIIIQNVQAQALANQQAIAAQQAAGAISPPPPLFRHNSRDASISELLPPPIPEAVVPPKHEMSQPKLWFRSIGGAMRSAFRRRQPSNADQRS